MRILVGVDGSPGSIHAATTAGALASRMGAELDLLYVVPTPLAPSPEGCACQVDLEGATGTFAQRMLEEVDHALGDPPTARMRILHGSAADVIAHQGDADDVVLIAVGCRGRGAVARAISGSISERVVQLSRKPVLVVK